MSLPGGLGIRRRAALVDVLGLAAGLFVLLDYFRPTLLFLPTIAAGGDTPCHFPTAAYLHDYLLPRIRLHGWYPGAYLGQPLLLYYFPLPFLLMSGLAPFTGLPVAFKLVTFLGPLLLPFFTYLAFRLMGFRFPGPLLGAASSFVFLFLEENPIWGGTIASTLTGEFCYAYGIAFGVLFLGLVYRAYARGSSAWMPALLLATTALAHGYAVLWAGLSASYFLYAARRPLRSLSWLLRVALVAAALAGVWLLPLLSGWGWTTPFADPWIEVTRRNLFPSLLQPLFVLATLGLGWTLLAAWRLGGPDHRLLYLAHAALVGMALAAAGPALGIIDVRFVPFAHFSACLLGGAALGLLLERTASSGLAALGFTLLALLWGDKNSTVLRSWIEWNYTGLESKELWSAFSEMAGRLKGSPADPRVAVEYSQEHERAGSIRMYETLPYFSGRSTLEGVYNQASLQTHAVYYLASELGATSPNPFRNKEYSQFDTDNALRHLRLFNVREIVALSPKLVEALERRIDVAMVDRIAPYVVFRLRDSGPGYVEPMAYAPVRSSWKGWREKSYRWFIRKPLSPAHLVFTDKATFKVEEKDEWLPPPKVPLPTGVVVSESVGVERLKITTNRVGHPLLVKISFHPRWKALGAEGPFLVSPALMMIVPTQTTVELFYSQNLSDYAGAALSLGALGYGVWTLVRVRGRTRAPRTTMTGPIPGLAAVEGLPVTFACEVPRRRRWGGLIPLGLIVGLLVSRFLVSAPERPATATELYDRASRAYAAGHYLDSAELAGQALRLGGAPLRGELLCLRGESLLKAGRPDEAAQAFQALIEGGEGRAYLPQALFGRAQAEEAIGEHGSAEILRERLRREFPDTPWAGLLKEKAK